MGIRRSTTVFRAARMVCLAALLLAFLAGTRQANAGNVLFLVGNTTLNTGDKAVQDTIKNMGHTVTVKTGLASVTADTAGKVLIVISSTITSADVGTKFLGVVTPVLTWENGLMPTMKMTGTVSGTDFGTTLTQTAIKMMQATHPMAAGLTGTPTILNSADTVSWGKPANGCFKIAQINSATLSDSNKVVIFGYEIGMAMVGQTATGRRVGFYLDNDAAAKWNTNGKNLLKSAVAWAITGNVPYFVTQPAPQTVLETATASFSIVAQGALPLTYQWRKNGTAISGAVAATYVTPPTIMSDNAANFSCLVTNAVGSTASANGLLTVNARPPVVSVPPASVTVFEGQTAAFTVAATGTMPFTYQWKKGGVPISGAVLQSYSTPPTTMADSNSQFTVTISNAAGNVTSAAGTLVVKGVPPDASPATSNSPVNDGDSAKFAVAHTGTPPFSYQWQRNGANVSGATAANYKFFPAKLSDNGASFRCIVTGRGGKDTSAPAVLAVNPLAVVFVRHPEARTVYEGQKAAFKCGATGSLPITFQWQRNTVSINGATDSTYTTPPLAMADSGAAYRCVVTNPAGSLASNTAIVSVRPYANFPVGQWVGVSGELRDDLGNLIGKGVAVEKDMTVRLFPSLVGGASAYQEDFTASSGQPVPVKDGFFTLYLGSGAANGDLNAVFSANASLFAEITVGTETLSPRTPVTAPAYAGAPRVIHGNGAPAQTAPIGTYYENDVDGSVWLRVQSRWTRVSN